MLFVELYVPRGALGQEERRRVGERIVGEVLSARGASPEVIQAARALSHVVVHEPEAWIAGGQPVGADEPPRYVVRVSIPGGHLSDQKSAEIVRRVTRVLAEADGDPDRLYREPSAWVHVIGVPEGGLGAFGEVMRSPDITRMVVSGGGSAAAGVPAPGPAPATAIDPVCGMEVAPERAVLLEHQGATYAFCCAGCRDAFLEDRRPVAAGSLEEDE